MGWLPFL